MTTSRTSACAWGAVLAIGASGCVGPATGTVVVRPRGAQLLAVDSGRYEPRRVDPHLTQAVGAYAREIERLEDLPEPEQRARMSSTLDLLAEAILSLPGATDDVDIAALGRMVRSDGDKLAQSIVDQNALEHGLLAASSALGRLADTRFADVPLVAARSDDLRRRVVQIRDSGRYRDNTADIVAALRAAALVLTSMHASLAWGTAP